jgi:hypothetical protein
MEYIWEVCSQILGKATNCEFRQAQSSTQATDTLRFAESFATGSQWMITRDQIQDLVRLGSHDTSNNFKLHSYGQLKAYCDQRRGQAAIIRKFYNITGGGTQDNIGFVAFQHPAIRKLIQEQYQLSDEQVDQICGVVPDELKVLLQQSLPLGTDFQTVPPSATAYLQNAGLSVPVPATSLVNNLRYGVLHQTRPCVRIAVSWPPVPSEFRTLQTWSPYTQNLCHVILGL